MKDGKVREDDPAPRLGFCQFFDSGVLELCLDEMQQLHLESSDSHLLARGLNPSLCFEQCLCLKGI